MANLLGQNIGTNYKGILSLDSTINTPLDATLRAVTDGEGNASPLQLSTDAVSVGAISGARLGIKGSGTTSATTALLVQNSAGTELLKVTDDGAVTANNLLIPNFNNITSGSNNINFQTSRILWTSSFNTPSGQYAYNFGDGGGFSTQTSGILGRFNLSSRFAPTSGTAIYNTSIITPIINQTGGANGITRGLFIDPTLTAAFDFRAIEVTEGNVLIGNGALNTAKLSIKGSGTTSATTALLVQNSAGTQLLKVLDDGNTFVKNLTIDNAMYGSSSGRMNIIPQYDLAIRPNVGGVGFAEGFGFSVNGSALIEMQSTTKGFLPPRMTTTQKNAIATPAAGLIVYDSTTNKLACYNGTTWNDLF